jgi:hypothetical protein
LKGGNAKVGDLPEAVHANQLANTLGPMPDFALTGYLFQIQNDLPDARRQYVVALTKKQQLKIVRNNLAAALINGGLDAKGNNDKSGIERAIDLTNLVLEEDAGCQPALINRAIAKFQKAITLAKGQPADKEFEKLRAESLADLAHALEVGPRSGELHYKFASVMAFPKPLDGEIEAIRMHLSEAIRLGIDVQNRPLTDAPWSQVFSQQELQVLMQQKPVASSAAKWQQLIPPRAELPEWGR